MGTGTALAQVPSSPISFAAKQVQYPQQYATIDIDVGHSQVLKLDRQFKTIVVGNPKVADVIIEDLRTILINAKAPAVNEKEANGNKTNVIVLDNANEPIYSVEVVVHGQQQTELIPSLANVRIYPGSGPGGKKQAIADYAPYSCGATDCVRLQPEYQKELSKDVYTTGFSHQEVKGSTEVNGTTQVNGAVNPGPSAPGS
jgi:hypothetical protein